MKKNYILLFVTLILCAGGAYAQGLAINTTGDTAHASAMLDVQSTDKGILISRMTGAQRNAIASPATSLLVYQTDDTAGFYYYTGSAWTAIGGSGGSLWTASGDNIHNTNTGRVGIGTAAPAARLHVADSSVVFTSAGVSSSPAAPPVSGAGSRMMWYADKAAFRAGRVDGTEWDKDSVGEYSIGLGIGCVAKGNRSIALGGNFSYAIGLQSTAISNGFASGDYSIAIGGLASGLASRVIGAGIASGDNSMAFGGQASGNGSVTLGNGQAIGDYSLAMGGLLVAGSSTFAMGNYSMAIGVGRYGDSITSKGEGSIAIGAGAHANGEGSIAIANGFSSFASVRTTASGEGSLAMGVGTTASGLVSTAIGFFTTASGWASTAMGFNTTASEGISTAMGGNTTASGGSSTAMGFLSTASGEISTAIGGYTTASGYASTAMGYYTIASGQSSTAMGGGLSGRTPLLQVVQFPRLWELVLLPVAILLLPWGIVPLRADLIPRLWGIT